MREAETAEFRRRWTAKFEEQAKLQKGLNRQNAWEGFDAYRELNDTHSLCLVLPSGKNGDSVFSSLTDRLSKEVEIYNLYKTCVVAVNQCFKIAIGALSAAEAKLKKAKTPESEVKSQVDEQLRLCLSTVEETRRSLEGRRDGYWEFALAVEIQEKVRAWGGWNPTPSQEELDSMTPEQRKEHVEWKTIFDTAEYPRDLVRQIDLDTRFQLRVALILRFYLQKDSGISLKTNSRLTVLTYICGKLRKEGPDRLFLKPNLRSGGVSVGGVDQKLRAAGLK
jgi:hypothetical protein